MNENLVNAILHYGEKAWKEYLRNQFPDCQDEDEIRNRLLTDWREALKFFFSIAYFQGRSDTLSEKFLHAMWEVLDPEIKETGRNLDRLNLDSLRTKLSEQIGRARVGKRGDIEMVVSTLRFLRSIPECNIVLYSVKRIEAGGTENLYYELQNLRNPNKRGIYQVGPKIAAVYLRDVASLYRLEEIVPDQEKYCLQPIDTWVRQLAVKIGLVEDGATFEEIQQAIVETCLKHGCSSAMFNKGLWYLGPNALKLLLENLQAHGV